MSKVLERFEHSHFRNFLTKNRLITNAQSEFRKLHSIAMSLIHVTESQLLKNIDESLVTGIVYIDLRKAIDFVNHDLLLQKLSGSGLRNMELNWFKSYLGGKSQAVAVDGNISDISPIIVGVPQ